MNHKLSSAELSMNIMFTCKSLGQLYFYMLILCMVSPSILFFHRIVDNLPCATKIVDLVTKEIQYRPGYLLGYQSSSEGLRPAYINNHLKLILYYHSHSG